MCRFVNLVIGLWSNTISCGWSTTLMHHCLSDRYHCRQHGLRRVPILSHVICRLGCNSVGAWYLKRKQSLSHASASLETPTDTLAVRVLPYSIEVWRWCVDIFGYLLCYTTLMLEMQPKRGNREMQQHAYQILLTMTIYEMRWCQD